MKITGKSLIDHAKQNKLGITCGEYAVLMFIVDKAHKSKLGLGELTIFDFIGFFGNTPEITTAIKSLETKGLIGYNNGFETYWLGEDVIKLFGQSIEAQFDEIWNIGHRDKDPKAKGKEAFAKALKIESFEVLRDKWKLFYDSCEDKQYLVSVYKFFDVKYKMWEDVKEPVIKKSNFVQ